MLRNAKAVSQAGRLLAHQAQGQAARGDGNPHGRARLEEDQRESAQSTKNTLCLHRGKVVVRSLGEKQLESLTEWLGYLQGAVREPLAS